MSIGIRLAEKGLLPDGFLRSGIRRLCTAWLLEEEARGLDAGDFAGWGGSHYLSLR